MSVLFSLVRLTSDTGSYTELLCGGIPACEEDLAEWSDYEDYLDGNLCTLEVQADVVSYLYGEGESVHADENDIAYLTTCMEEDKWFIEEQCDYVSDSRFSFAPSMMEDFDEMEM